MAKPISAILGLLKKIAGPPRRIKPSFEGEYLALRMWLLEQELKAKEAKQNSCPKCGNELKTVEVMRDTMFGVFGHQRHTKECVKCGYQEDRLVVPDKGK